MSVLLNEVISNMNNLTHDELNTVWACILFKGHGKDRSLDSSYRTISTCPFTCTLLTCTAPSGTPTLRTPQKNSSSHDLAALTLTETISYSLHVLSKPVFALYLDAKSAYDLVVREYLIQELFETGISDQGLIMIDKRLANRKTICEWSKILMGTIKDQCGVEQGGVNSSDYY